ncbi:hypothetical protein FN846DRAFT_941588 [Sphaerosporella brunnea]|uniref:HCP-like protein n=1 Tax=Sphaerosporella brunnea TaxID=1250544 RepID=A0A5J5F222_9PEZI|nr:hypothetical protein FN846DRAFT_941588 [Sphaerosporella brunnea]
MPEVPDQITDSLRHLELEANAPRGYQPPRAAYQEHYANPTGSRPLSEDRHSSYHSSIGEDYLAGYGGLDTNSPFPRLINPGPNIPPSDDEKEAQIEGARMEVLSSNDPEMQLVWAQDALNYVEIAMNYYTRIADPPGRPQTPALEHQIKVDAINVVSFLADQHHPRAEFMRGNWLEFGKFGFRVDKKEAFRCYARSGDKGFARAEYRMGMQFENSNEPQKAIARYERGARMGDAASNYRLGMMTLLGQHGQRQDYARGCELIRIAAENADENAPQGAYVYGMLIARELPGVDVPEGYLPVDIQLAREMIEKAAFLGFSRAQLKMGTAYELCQLGCDFNPALSMHYNALAARQGEGEAEMAISKWFLCGHEGVFEKNEELAYEYARRAAASGLGTAEFAIGYFYEIGMYVKVDLKEAQRWYAKAAEHGNKDATGRIDGISRSKTLSRRDHENVAIAKIKSRHGSMRGKKNPLTERRPPPPAMPSAIEEVEMPDPVIPPAGQYYPPRGNSIAPLNTNFIRTDDSPHATGGPGTIPPAGTYPAGPPRAGTAMGALGNPGPNGSFRKPSGGPPGPGRMPYPGPQGYPPNNPVKPDGQYGAGSGPDGKPRPPPVDIGFVAPDIKPPRSPAPRPPKSPISTGTMSSGQGGRLPLGSGGPATPMSPGPNGKPGLPNSPAPGGAPWSAPPQPEPAPAPAPPAPAPIKSPAAGKGPKTFEEMGVPQQTKEQDCVIM